MLTLKPSISETNGFSFAHFWKPLWMNSLGEKIGGVISKADTASRYSMEMLIEIPTEAGAAARGAASLAESQGMATTAAGQTSTHIPQMRTFLALSFSHRGGDIVLTRGWESPRARSKLLCDGPATALMECSPFIARILSIP